MTVKTDRRTSNLFIAGGYCLVAIIILFNYLGQSDSKDRTRAAVASAGSSDAAQPGKNDDSLARQLEEEKRLNLEMRDIIKRLQGAISDPSATASSQQHAHGPGDFSIPRLRDDLIDNAFKNSANPFIPGKNPFAAARPNTDSAAEMAPVTQFSTMQCDPRLPFIFSGSNTSSGYFSNL